jgi:hypothetical protein
MALAAYFDLLFVLFLTLKLETRISNDHTVTRLEGRLASVGLLNSRQGTEEDIPNCLKPQDNLVVTSQNS